MVQLQANLEAIRAAGAQLVAISYDREEVLKRFASRRGIGFALLSDPESRVIDSYGVRNQEARGRAAGIPHPGTFLIDRQGVIRARLFRDAYSERHDPTELIQAIKALPTEN